MCVKYKICALWFPYGYPDGVSLREGVAFLRLLVGIGLAVVDSEVQDLRSALSLLSFPDGRDRNWIKFRVQLSLKCGVSSCVYTYVATSADWLIL